MLESSTPASYAKVPHTIPTLTSLAHERYRRAIDQHEYEMEQETDKICPPRKVRSFRLIRFRDVQPCDVAIKLESGEGSEETRKPPVELGQGLSEKRSACRRSLLLHVWDVDKMQGGKNAFVVGQKYRVSNLSPTQRGAWVGGPNAETDVYLTTRRDTKWTKLT